MPRAEAGSRCLPGSPRSPVPCLSPPPRVAGPDSLEASVPRPATGSAEAAGVTPSPAPRLGRPRVAPSGSASAGRPPDPPGADATETAVPGAKNSRIPTLEAQGDWATIQSTCRRSGGSSRKARSCRAVMVSSGLRRRSSGPSRRAVVADARVQPDGGRRAEELPGAGIGRLQVVVPPPRHDHRRRRAPPPCGAVAGAENASTRPAPVASSTRAGTPSVNHRPGRRVDRDRAREPRPAEPAGQPRKGADHRMEPASRPARGRGPLQAELAGLPVVRDQEHGPESGNARGA